MKLSRSQISKLFFSAKDYKEFSSSLEKAGFVKNLDGINKHVFIHPEWHWVVKLAHGFNKAPRAGAKVNKFYLPHCECGTRRFEDMYDGYTVFGADVQLLFQRKVERVGDYDLYQNFSAQLCQKRIYGWDSHENNVGLLGKRTVIIDY